MLGVKNRILNIPQTYGSVAGCGWCVGILTMTEVEFAILLQPKQELSLSWFCHGPPPTFIGGNGLVARTLITTVLEQFEGNLHTVTFHLV